MIVRPTTRAELERKRKNRIAEIANGAPERYFEEKRRLEAYPISRWIPKSLQGATALGVIVMVAGILSIVFGLHD